MHSANNTGFNRYASNLAKNAPQEVLMRLAQLRTTLQHKKPSSPPTTPLQKLRSCR